MAYLNINKLAEGRIFKGSVTDIYNQTMERYVKMQNGYIVRSENIDGPYSVVPETLYQAYMTTNSWVEVKEVTKQVPVLTELAKELLVIEGIRVVVEFSTAADSKQFLEAVENSTEFTWGSGRKATKSTRYGNHNDVIFLYNDEKQITWDYSYNLTSNIRGAKSSIYLDYDLMGTELVEILEVKGYEDNEKK